MKIKATPRLHDDDEVTLQLQFDIKSLTGTDINGIPILSNRQIEQTIRLRENETSVISGLLQSNQIGSTSGLPWTSTVPGIGLLTGEDTTNIQQTELVILVTPRALRLPPHDVPAVYAGRGEPATPPSGPACRPAARASRTAQSEPAAATRPAAIFPRSPARPGARDCCSARAAATAATATNSSNNRHRNSNNRSGFQNWCVNLRLKPGNANLPIGGFRDANQENWRSRDRLH